MARLAENQLVDKTKPWGEITFIHFKDGSTRKFYSCVNDMSGSRLSAFDSDAPGIDDPMPWVKSVFKGIHQKATKVLSCEGTICKCKQYEKSR